MRIPFDHHTVPVLPWTRMSGTSKAVLSPVRLRLFRPGWAVAVLALAVSSIPSFAGGFSLAQKHETRHEIDQLEDAWRNAVLTADVRAMDSLLAADYMAITPNGLLQSREETLQGLRSGRMHFTSITITDRKVRFYGNTAVVTSLATIQGSTPEGPVTGDFRYTRVYVRNPQGIWKIVSFEASRVGEPGPRRHGETH
jgi:ketosteroid isomerase-like protein